MYSVLSKAKKQLDSISSCFILTIFLQKQYKLLVNVAKIDNLSKNHIINPNEVILMLIIKILKRITGLNQEDLANLLDVSRASINSWENSDQPMTTYQKNVISKKLNIDIELLSDDLLDNYEKCQELYLAIQARWNLYNKNITISKEEEILNKLEFQFNREQLKLSTNELLEGLTNGYNPYTGELFDDNHILNDQGVKNVLTEIKNTYYKQGNYSLTKDDLSSSQLELFEELRKWRMDMTVNEGFYSAYMVFTDKELINIITASINKKEDLLSVKGIAAIKYEKYSDDLFYILQNKKYDLKIE